MTKEVLDIVDLIKELIEEDYPRGSEIVFSYVDTIDKYGLTAKETTSLYHSIVKEHEPLKLWLDFYNRLG